MSYETERPRSAARPGCQPASGCDVVRAISHLPAVKQRQLCAIVRIIRATADVEGVILYGSHARGDWVDDPAMGYASDYDLAVLVASPALAADEALWADCQDRTREMAGHTPVSLIVHTVDDLRQQIARGSSFFRDVITEGVALYDAGRVAITVPELTPAMHHALAESSLQRYFEHAAQLYRSFERNLADGSLAIAAFEFHQVAETICKVVLVVFTAYLPKTHDIDELGCRCARACPDLGPLVSQDAPDRKRLAGLLRAAYVDARYSFTFQVSREDLEVLARHARRVQGTRRACMPGTPGRAGCGCARADRRESLSAGVGLCSTAARTARPRASICYVRAYA